ncbi:MAG: EAL domain-containing protein [Dokdonella sp.]
MKRFASPAARSPARSYWRRLVLIACLALPAVAQAEAVRRDFFFQTIDTEQGLAQNSVSAFLQDRTGFIWLGTSSGLQRYDGYGFITYEYTGDGANSPPAGPVSALAEDKDGDLWIGTNGAGLIRRAAADGSFTRMTADDASTTPGMLNVHALLPASRGVWVASDAGVALVDARNGHLLRLLPIVPKSPDDHRPPQVFQMTFGSNGTLWIASEAGLLRLLPDAVALERVASNLVKDARGVLIDHAGRLAVATMNGVYRIAPDASAQRIWPVVGEHGATALIEDARSRLWLATPREGLAIFDSASGDTRWLTPSPGLAGTLPDAAVACLGIDRSGLLWIGTRERGVAKVDPNGTLFRYLVDRDPAHDRTAANYVRAVFEDTSGGLWLGTEGDGLKRYDATQNRFDYYNDVILRALKTDARSTRLTVFAIADAGRGNLWVATNYGAGELDPQQRTFVLLPEDASGVHGLPDPDVRALLVARDGALWLGTRGGLVRHDPRTDTWRLYQQAGSGTDGLSDNRVMALHEDRDGRIWAGAISGLNVIDPASGSVRVLRNNPTDPHSLSDNLVRAIHETSDGVLWVGTQTGLNRLDTLDAQHARFTRWLPRGGLPSGTVYAIANDQMGRLWLSTNRGIATFDRSTEIFRSFTREDGLQGMEFNGGASAQLRDGTLAFGGVNGLNLFSPQAIVGSRYAAPIVLTDVHVGTRAMPIAMDGSPLNMAAAERIVRFEFAALDFAAPERNRFAYQLEGFDDHWIDAGTRHEATYTNLAPGHYRFMVRAANHDGHWNEQAASLALEVMPPWWDSLIARALYVLFGAFAIAMLWHAQRRKRKEEASIHHDLREREDRLFVALWGSGDDFWDWHVVKGQFVVTGSSDLFKGDSRQSICLPYDWLRQHLHPDDLPLVETRLEQHINQVTESFESEHRLRNHRGEWIWSHARGKIVERDEDGQPLRMAGTARDVTQQRAAEHDRRIAHEVIRSMAEAVAVTDLEFNFLSVNPAFTRITGWRQQEVAGQSAAVLNCAQHAPEHYLTMREKLSRSGHWRGELWQKRKDGGEFLSWIEISEVRDASGVRTHFVGVLSDITDRKRTEQELRYLANFDALTGLPNRTLLSERIGLAIIRARRSSHKVALLFLDLDRFKHINDSLGHTAGDRVLKAVGGRLRHIVREGDSVARLGGDEFTIVLEDIDSTAEAERVAEKVIASFQEPLELDTGQEVTISPSIGISLYPDHGQNPSDLLKFADTAMYQAKDAGRKTWMVYTEAMDAAARLRATTVAALRKALERNELSLVYQPKMSLLDERITGVEALLRWRSQDLGNVSPGVFIPIAEESGLIIEIGDWVVAQACARLAEWRDAGMTDITMSVNVSVAQLLRGDLIRRLCDVLAEHDIAPHLLELELTESMVMANAEQSITMLRRLKAIGVTLTIDDFGTGYSSLSYLKRLPIDALKIDKEFVGDITTDPDDDAITATVITMAHSMGLNVIAEGVERAEQVEYLREQRCDEIQGHWLSFPLTPDECLAFLHQRAQKRLLEPGTSE